MNILTIYIVLLFVILLFQAKPAGKGNFHEDFLSLSNAKSLQGFATITIILHHLTQKVTAYGAVYKGPITFFNMVGILCTGIFFFYSGYGLLTSLMTKEDYLDGFLKKRYTKILIPFYLIHFMFCVLMLPSMSGNTPGLVVCNVLGLVLVNNQMWYIVEIAILYLAFYLIYKNPDKRKYAMVKMIAVVVVMMAGSLLLVHDVYTPTQGIWFMGEWWYNTTGLFVVGMLVARYQKGFVALVQRCYKRVVACGTVLLFVLFVWSRLANGIFGYWSERPGNPGYLDKFVTLISELPYVTVFVLLFLIISMKVKFDNAVLRFLGTISLELYLVHNVFIMKLGDKGFDDAVLFAIVYAGGIILAVVFHWLSEKISRLIKVR